MTDEDTQPAEPPRSALEPPAGDPTSIFEAFRGVHSTELLTAAVAHFEIFTRLEGGALDAAELREMIGLGERPFVVLSTALKAMGLLAAGSAGELELTSLAREHLLPGRDFYVGDYVRLAADNPSVLAMVDSLRADRPRGSDPEEGGAAYIYRDGIKSAMEDEEAARFLTMALAGRAANVAPLLARAVVLGGSELLLDVAAGSGIYSAALLQANPGLRAIAWERPEVVKVALELAGEYGLGDRLDHYPVQLSGGEQQRVNIARGFITDHAILLLDEPTASLDATNRRVVVDMIREKKEKGTALLGIFHDEEVREAVADRILDVSQFSPRKAAA